MQGLCKAFILVWGIVLIAPTQAWPTSEKPTPAERLRLFNAEALRLAIEDLSREFGDRYRDGSSFLESLDRYEQWAREIREAANLSEQSGLWGWQATDSSVQARVDEILAFQRKALLANPLLERTLHVLAEEPPSGTRQALQTRGRPFRGRFGPPLRRLPHALLHAR